MECIEILDSDEEAAANNAQAPPESDDDVEIVGGAPAPGVAGGRKVTEPRDKGESAEEN